MAKYSILVCETHIITTDLDIEIEAETLDDAEALILDYLENDKLRDHLQAKTVITEDLREYEVISQDEDFDDTDQLKLPEIVIPVQEMPAARR